MVKPQPNNTETPTECRVDDLLGVLRRLAQQDPPAALRDRLQHLAAVRLNHRDSQPKTALRRLRPAFVMVALIAFVSVLVWVTFARRPEPPRAPTASHSIPPAAPVARAISSTLASQQKPSRRVYTVQQSSGKQTRRMVLPLPYSNRAIDTGTDTTIQVSMSQAELLALGFPVNTTVHDRRVLADLTLGDDGLPRALSVPLPLEIVREKK